MTGLVVVGDDAQRVQTLLRDAGVDTSTIARVETAVFDEDTHTWRVTDDSGKVTTARVVIAAESEPVGEPYLGVATHGRPNYFYVSGPDSVARLQVSYIAACLEVMERRGDTRMEVLNSTQRSFVNHNRGAIPAWPGTSAPDWERVRRKITSAFDLCSFADRDTGLYDGPATVTLGTNSHEVRVRLTGQLDPIDGRYHWRGTVSDFPGAKSGANVELTVGERMAKTRLAERTPWGSYSVSGTGPPPFALDDVELVLPHR